MAHLSYRPIRARLGIPNSRMARQVARNAALPSFFLCCALVVPLSCLYCTKPTVGGAISGASLIDPNCDS
jgi:hypothetical protein